MADATLLAAIAGVLGTLLAPVLSQRLLGQQQAQLFDRQQGAATAHWLREQAVAELDRRRDCYKTVNAIYRRYRTHLMNFLWHVHKGEVTPEAREAVEEARREHHAAYAEAQMIATTPVLEALDDMTKPCPKPTGGSCASRRAPQTLTAHSKKYRTTFTASGNSGT